MAPPTTRSQGGPSSSQPQQQPTPTPKDTIEVQGKESKREEVEEEVEEKTEKEYGTKFQKRKEKEKEPTVDEKLYILMTEVRALKKKNAEFAQQQRASTLPLFGANQIREGTIPPPSYHGMPDVKGYKPTPPKPYDGSTDVEGFLVQARLHLKFYESSLTEDYQKVMAIFQLLTGRVLLWFEPIMRDYLQNYPDESSDMTNYIFSKYGHFKERMRALFGDPDKEQHAVKQLHLLRQTKSASEYTTEFNRLAAISNLPESALFYPYYDGLKPQVKDEMYMEPKMGSFAEYTDKAIIADRRTFDRYLEKKGTGKRSDDKGFSSRTKKDKGKP
ncbi:hypothetical protein DL763_006226 [Monosporascus cannonballus]|nr:hypothetical protein DL763_006226 [Monosporascus cannonballus]